MEAKVIFVESYVPEVVIKQEDYKSFRRYLSEGFSVIKRKEGYYTLRKKGKILVTIEYDGKRKVVNFRKALLEMYGRAEEYNVIKKFKSDLLEGKVAIDVDSEGYCSIIET